MKIANWLHNINDMCESKLLSKNKERIWGANNDKLRADVGLAATRKRKWTKMERMIMRMTTRGVTR
jgi:hypothetical protein